jgi:hypothetical protein
MVEYSDLYGFLSEDLDEVARVIASSLGVHFSPHESLYHGGNYYLGEDENASVTFRLQRNLDLLETEPGDAWAEPEFKRYPNLLYIDGGVAPLEIEKAILETFKDAAALLRREALDLDSVGRQS